MAPKANNGGRRKRKVNKLRRSMVFDDGGKLVDELTQFCNEASTQHVSTQRAVNALIKYWKRLKDKDEITPADLLIRPPDES
jgi:hypothetical protein